MIPSVSDQFENINYLTEKYQIYNILIVIKSVYTYINRNRLILKIGVLSTYLYKFGIKEFRTVLIIFHE